MLHKATSSGATKGAMEKEPARGRIRLTGLVTKIEGRTKTIGHRHGIKVRI